MKLWLRLLLSFTGMLAFTFLLAHLGGIRSFGNILFFIDSVSFVLIIFYTLLASLITYSFREGWALLTLTWKRDINDSITLKKGVLFLRHLADLVLQAGVIGFLIGVILMMGNLEDTSHVGPNMAVALISILYAFILRIVVLQPLKNSLEQRILGTD